MVTAATEFARRLDALDPSSVAGSIVFQRDLLISSGNWIDAGKASLSVYNLALHRVLRKEAIPAASGLAYWRQIPTRGLSSTLLFILQNGPFMAYNYIRSLTRSTSTAASAPRRIRAAQLVPPVFEYGSVMNTARSVVRRILFEWKRFISVLYEPVSWRVETEITRLADDKQVSNVILGKLLADTWLIGTNEPIENIIQHACKQMSEIFDLPCGGLNTPQDVILQLQKVLNNVNAKRPLRHTIPPLYVRWWPCAVISAGALWWLLGSWQSIVQWCKSSLFGTLESFWANWVMEPLYSIYLTIRHDPNAEIALLGKQSLQSDLDSLERMVVDFMEDKDGHALSTQTIDDIKNEVRQGNLTPILRVYEQQIETPLKSILTGGLIRTLLIQVQKTKVDAEVALHGIDKMLQSQQLVFVLVAALPALACLFWLTGILYDLLSSKSDLQGMLTRRSASKESILSRLGVIENVALSNNELTFEDLGEVYCEVAQLDQYIKTALPASEAKRFSSDLVWLVGKRDSQSILNDLLRIYAKY